MDDGAPRVDLSAPVDELHSNERLKHESRFLRGTLVESLADTATGAVDPDDALLTKFFGIYQQDDRDLRDERRRAKLEPRYQFMVRVRLPGGVCTPQQWLALDELARECADGTLRLTTRQTFQFHGIRKRNLRRHIQALCAAGLDTIAACGDDNRNVIATANPLFSPAHAAASALARRIGEHLLPRTRAYSETFLEAEPAQVPIEHEEPLYGPTYLPRKFKIALAIPPRNDIDVFAHDLGFIAIVGEGGATVGYNVSVGGGMGMTHKVPTTFPRLADVIGFCEPDSVLAVAEQTMSIQRDYGNRKDRARARFKYTIEDRGLDWFKAELARRLGHALEPARPFVFESSADALGWAQGTDGRWHYTLFVENGRVHDRGGVELQSGLRAIASEHDGVLALTTNQNVVIAGVAEDDRPRIDGLLERYGIANARTTRLRAGALACVALPTCGLAMAESERYLPTLLDKLDALIFAAGLDDEPISIRMSGCPNGCSRPYLAEIALVGKSPGKYNLYLGAAANGERMNALYKEGLGEAEIVAALAPLFARYAAKRSPGESFGDFVVRSGIVRATVAGREFQHVS